MITLLTRPIIPFKLREIKYFCLSQLNCFRGLPPRSLPAYGGHPAVTRSICEGFRKLGVEFNLDPQRLAEVGETVVCLADPRSLAQAIGWKKRRKIQKLFAGYTIFGSALDHDRMAMSSELDGYLCFSGWHLTSFDLACPDFKEKAFVAPFGVDAADWTTAPDIRRPKRVLFYKKRAPHFLYNRCLQLVKERGYEVEEIVYGNYSLSDYRDSLQRASILVNWVDHETQGISMAEAWASDVPTLVWNPGFVFQVVHGRNYVFDCSSSPYLSDSTGRFFRESDDLLRLLDDFSAGELRFSPRDWLLKNLTDKICAERLHSILTASASAITSHQ